MSNALSSGDVCEVAGVPANTLDRWVRGGLLAPAGAGRGHGRHCRYTLGEAVAVAAGTVYRAAGAGPDRVAGVVRTLAAVGLERLEAELAAAGPGQTWRVVPVPAALFGCAWLPGGLVRLTDAEAAGYPPDVLRLLRALDLAPVVVHVKQAVAVIARREPNRRGRNRGLPGQVVVKG